MICHALVIWAVSHNSRGATPPQRIFLPLHSFACGDHYLQLSIVCAMQKKFVLRRRSLRHIREVCAILQNDKLGEEDKTSEDIIILRSTI